MKKQKQLQPREVGPLFDQPTDIPVSKSSLLQYTFKDFFYWWYVQMPIFIMVTVKRTHDVINDQLSILLLIRNFFTPWQRRYNLPSLIFGILLKTIYLPIAIAVYISTMVLSISTLLLWIAFPLLTSVFLILTPLIQR